MNRLQALEYRKNKNVRAFLDTIGKSEGAGYRTLVHQGAFNSALKDLSRHPNKVFTARGGRLPSTAAGKYQFLHKTWDRFRKALGLTDFSPLSQDLAAIAQLAECGSLPFIIKGDFPTAVSKARKIWASFPGAGYGQGERSLSTLQKYYNAALDTAGEVADVIEDNPGIAGGSALAVLLIGVAAVFF